MPVLWEKELHALRWQPEEPILSWLTKPTVLSEALKRHYSSFSVQVLVQTFELAREDEREALHIPLNEPAFVRQVVLECDNVARTMGRVVVPMTTYQQYQTAFEQLAHKPIGETLLYGKADVRREAFEYAFIPFTDEFPILNGNEGEGIFARRSIFWLKTYPLLVTDFFLPTLSAYVPATTC